MCIRDRICAEHDVTISLGDACRPGCLADATDVCQIEELVRLGELTKRAWAHNVQVMVEGPGHVPLNQVAANMEVQKSICMGAPFYAVSYTHLPPRRHPCPGSTTLAARTSSVRCV